VVAQPAAEGVAGVVAAAVPVPQPVEGDPEGDGLVVPVPQFFEQVRVDGGLAAGPGVLDGGVRLAEDGDHVAGPGLRPAGTQFGDGAASPDDVLAALLDAGELWQELLVGGVPVGDQENR
jgi:hypothetical protein